MDGGDSPASSAFSRIMALLLRSLSDFDFFDEDVLGEGGRSLNSKLPLLLRRDGDGERRGSNISAAIVPLLRRRLKFDIRSINSGQDVVDITHRLDGGVGGCCCRLNSLMAFLGIGLSCT